MEEGLKKGKTYAVCAQAGTGKSLIAEKLREAETGEQRAEICRLEALDKK